MDRIVVFTMLIGILWIIFSEVKEGINRIKQDTEELESKERFWEILSRVLFGEDEDNEMIFR